MRGLLVFFIYYFEHLATFVVSFQSFLECQVLERGKKDGKTTTVGYHSKLHEALLEESPCVGELMKQSILMG